MTVLTPLCALTVLAAVFPLLAYLGGRAKSDVVRKRLGLPAPGSGSEVRPLVASGAIALLGLAASQPALTHTTSARSRIDAQAVFVFDVSRSMAAAASPTSPTRLDRAAAAALKLRAAIGDVPSGVLTLTDRVLPDLLPVADRTGFDGVVDGAVRIESPPPHATAFRATSFAALSQIESGNVFAPSAKKRIVVLLTDGESDPVPTSDLARALAGYRFEAIRFWQPNEAVFDADGKRESAYRPDPSSRLTLTDLAGALGGRSYDESQIRRAASRLRSFAGSGPTGAGPSTGRSRVPLAPWIALAALLALLASLTPTAIRSTKQ